MYNTETRLKKSLEELTENEQYRLLEMLEDEKRIHIEPNSCNIAESLTNILLEVTSLFAKVLRIVK